MSGCFPAPLVVICGPMFAGKSTELLRRVERAQAEGREALVAKPARDTRYSRDAVVTHDGARLPAVAVASATELAQLVLARAALPTLVAIDEIHFFAEEAVAPIAVLRARGVAVAVAGCDLDHFGEVFAPFGALLPAATEVVRLRGVCARCGAESTHSERLVPATDRIIVGGAAEFIATCAACFRPSQKSD
ncbi:MAG: thymidine kinase [Planctomycetota bacterium]